MESMPFNPTIARSLLFSFSAASAALLPVWLSIFQHRGTPFDPQFLPNHHQLPYFDRLDYLAGAIVLVALTLSLFVLFLLARRFVPEWSRYLVMAVTGSLLLLGLNVVRTFYLPRASFAALRDAFLGSPVLVSLVLVAGCISIAFIVGRLQRQLIAISYLGAPVGIVVLVNVAGAIFAFGKDSVVADPVPLAPVLTESTRQSRVVWIIFDELDYRLAFEARPAGLDLPHFDRLRSSGLFATNATPPGQSTFPSIPALTTGRWLDDAHFDAAAGAVVRPRGQTRPVPWGTLGSVFSDARHLGVNVGILGQQYIPYCRVYHADAGVCREWGGAWPVRSRTALRHSTDFARRLLAYVPVINRKLFPEKFDAGVPYVDFQQAVNSAVLDPRLSLIFVHWMIPHTPYVYDRKTGAFTIPNERAARYFDNISLADRFLGETVSAIVQSENRVDNTYVIVSSDHSWKRSDRFDGRSDSRVPFLVWRPGSGAGVTYRAAFNTIATKRIALALLDGRLDSYADIAAFIARGPDVK